MSCFGAAERISTFWSKFVGRDSYYLQNDIPENFYQRDTASASNRFSIALLQRFDFRHPAAMASLYFAAKKLLISSCAEHEHVHVVVFDALVR